MLTNGANVTREGSHRNAPFTSLSGLTDVSTMTYSGKRANAAMRVRPPRRAHRAAADSRIGFPPRPERPDVDERDDQQERQHQHRHRGAEAKVPVTERVDVDVEAEHVRRVRRGAAE